jgi:hypothetical protein
MNVTWPVWTSELERIPPFSEEWNEGLAEEFILNLRDIMARKRAQRETVGKLIDELNRVRTAFSETLAFFHLERNCQFWDACNCPGSQVEYAIDLLGQWRADLQRYSRIFPPPRDKTQSYAAVQECCLQAEKAIAALRPVFGTLHNLLSPQAPAAEPRLKACPQPEPAAIPCEIEPAAAA